MCETCLVRADRWMAVLAEMLCDGGFAYAKRNLRFNVESCKP